MLPRGLRTTDKNHRPAGPQLPLPIPIPNLIPTPLEQVAGGRAAAAPGTALRSEPPGGGTGGLLQKGRTALYELIKGLGAFFLSFSPSLFFSFSLFLFPISFFYFFFLCLYLSLFIIAFFFLFSLSFIFFFSLRPLSFLFFPPLLSPFSFPFFLPFSLPPPSPFSLSLSLPSLSSLSYKSTRANNYWLFFVEGVNIKAQMLANVYCREIEPQRAPFYIHRGKTRLELQGSLNQECGMRAAPSARGARGLPPGLPDQFGNPQEKGPKGQGAQRQQEIQEENLPVPTALVPVLIPSKSP